MWSNPIEQLLENASWHEAVNRAFETEVIHAWSGHSPHYSRKGSDTDRRSKMLSDSKPDRQCCFYIPGPSRIDLKLMGEVDRLKEGSYVVMMAFAPIYTSLLAKGVAVYVFWHASGLYHHDVILSAQELVKDHQPAPPSNNRQIQDANEITSRYPNIMLSTVGGDIPGNGPASPEDVTKGTLVHLQKKWRAVFNAGGTAARRASASDIAVFLQIMQENRSSSPYQIEEFNLLDCGMVPDVGRRERRVSTDESDEGWGTVRRGSRKAGD
ncbi:hypothetical protein B0H13DRAFT_1890491 [Mycena leptocephala]|nr:hypothetical protein B0H13DRAFT_1890491 [Mycena leptocephala]